ncbi:hypothetical protein U9M48_017616 [Paspalum notatum var. saurae]|uniref:Uncharacterized protein n=1 Tax=Paspalum notatum var. saurae TaxID=547442 RepID=A0AAQ3TBA9_PASNO
MEFPKREPALPQGSPRRSPKAMRPAAATEGDENASPKRPVPACAASPPQRKKVLGQRNDGGGVGGTEANASPPAPQPKPKPAPTPPTLAGRGAGPYDPKTNYTTPRPEFLRYDPERRREILLRVARAAEVEFDDCSSTASGTADSEDDGGSVSSGAALASPVSSARTSDSKAELDDGNEGEEEEEVVAPARRGRWARRPFLLLVAVACSFCYIYCMNPTAFPVYSKDDIDLVGTVGGLYDDGDHALDSWRFLGADYMMDPEGVLEETVSQTAQQHTEDVVHLYDQRISPRNLVAVTMIGLADICLNVPLGEFTCQIAGESSENVSDLKESSELDKLEIEAAIEYFLNGEQNSEVGCLSGTISLDSIGSTCHSADMEEGSSGLVHQEEGETHSDRSGLQLVSMETTIKPVSDKLIDTMGLESQELNLWQHENTAEAAKAICSTVRFLWSAMGPHFLQILVWLSVAGMVAALFICYQRSRHTAAPASQHVNSKSHGEVPALVPHQVVQLPVPSSPQAVQLPGLTVPNQALHLSPRFKVPMDAVQKSLPKPDLFVRPKADSMKASNGNFLNHRDVDSSKPPVVELLGEFMFANNSSIQKLPELLKKDVEKMQMDFSIVRSPNVQRERTEENPVKGEKIPASVTPTPLRRSNRLRDKVTTP